MDDQGRDHAGDQPLTSASTFFLTDKQGMPVVGFGTYQLTDDEAEASTLAALQAGYRHVDTAQGYHNEAGVGRGIKASGLARGDVFVTTKLWPGNAAWGMPVMDFDQTIACAEASVASLGLEYVDLYLIHAPFAFAGGVEAGLAQWKALLALKARGLCRAVGVSNFGVAHLAHLEAAGLALPDANQLELHPLHQQRGTLAWMAARGILPIAYSSLAPLGSWRVKDDGSKHGSGKDRAAEAGVAAAAAVAAVAASHSDMRGAPSSRTRESKPSSFSSNGLAPDAGGGV